MSVLKFLRRHAVIAIVAVLLNVVAFGVPAQAFGPASVSELAARLSGAVVNIGTSRMVRGSGGAPFPDVPEGSPLNDLFDGLNPNSGQGEEAMREARSLGSGFFVSAEGHVVTNNHVIEGADEIFVFTPDGERFVAELIGADAKVDLAVLKISTDEPVPFVAFGDSDTAEVGDWVMVIGNPFGLGGSVSLGIVSARNRDFNDGPYDDFIQTDAAINQGNSGGPIFDMDGNVVGIATAIVSRGGGSMGVGFAVPGNLASPIIDQLAEFGETRRGWLGVGIQEVTSDIAISMGHLDPLGALVVEVTPGGPADGLLREGDLILRFDGEVIEQVRDLPRAVALTEVGKPVVVSIVRSREELDIEMVLGRLETGELLIAESRRNTGIRGEGAVVIDDGVRLSIEAARTLGFSVEPLTKSTRSELGIVASVNGVVISDIIVNSDAANKGLLPGLVVAEINQLVVEDIAEMEAIVSAAREAQLPALLFKLWDPGGGSYFVALRLRDEQAG